MSFGAPSSTGGLFGARAPDAAKPSPAPQRTTTPAADPLPADVAALQSIINSLKAELKATNSVNTHLASSVARLQVEQAITTTPAPAPPPLHTATGGSAGSPEIFKQMAKTNLTGCLGRAHMADVDALPHAALLELDNFLKRRMRVMFPLGTASCLPSVDEVFGGLAALGLRLEETSRYQVYPAVNDDQLYSEGMVKRARHMAAFHYANQCFTRDGYMLGLMLETVVELARYRGLFDDEGYLEVE